VRAGALGDGLIGQSYAPVGKTLLFSGAADGAAGQNMEGLALGPRLANGSWVLLGVVDNAKGADPLSFNTLVAFTATANLSGDFDADGDVDGADLLAWQRGVGKAAGVTLGDGDGDRDGDVEADDLAIWTSEFAATMAEPVPEPTAAALLALALATLNAALARGDRLRRELVGNLLADR
jgi:hypothetical protein